MTAAQRGPRVPTKIGKNSLVMFRNRVQKQADPMRVDKVRETDNGRECCIGGYWWLETNLMPYAEWQAKQGRP